MSNVYGCKNKEDSIRKESSSGGAFTALAECILEQGGVVCGAAFKNIYTVEHICIQNKNDLNRLRGSKYVLSNIRNCLRQVKEFLEQNALVLFSGTPCQVAGLLNYLGKNYENLYTADFICHGVPEMRAWDIYLKDLHNNYNKNVSHDGVPNFRNKNKGWYDYQISIPLDNGKHLTETKRKNAYMKAFLNDYILLPACYNCKNKGENRKSDLTLGDFWGIDNLDKDFYDNLGVSLVITNTQKGELLFHNAKKKMEYRKYNKAEALVENSSYNITSKKPRDYDEFWKQIKLNSFSKEIEARVKAENLLIARMIRLYNIVYCIVRKGKDD